MSDVHDYTTAQRFGAKDLVRRFFALFGLRICRLSAPRRIGGDKYFNTGALTPRQENSRELYDCFYRDREALTEYFQGYRLDFYQAVSAQVRAMEVALDDKDVLVVGCGTGHLLSELRAWSRPRSLAGCDFSEEAMKFSREKFPGCDFFGHDIYEPLRCQYDAIFCTEVIEHLERPHIGLANLISAIRSGGTLILTVPNGRRDTANEHINFWSPESWTAFLERECPGLLVKTTTLMEDRINFGLISVPAQVAK